MNRSPTAPICRYSRIKYTQKALKQPCRSLSRASTLYYNATPASRTSSQTDWNNHDEFFKFTRGRFLVDEAINRRMREIQFDMNSLARVAAESVGATHCTSIQKYPDGMFNKAFLMSMDNGREVVAKVPNPNAGIPHLTTASEVATMDFVQLTQLDPGEARNVLETPVPRVYTWNSHAQSHPVGAEFIIMEKAAGVPLSHVWETLKLPQKLQVLLAMISLQKKWLSVSFSHYDTALTTPHLWHNDLHDDNIFIDPQNPETITSVIDWQSTHISPLFTHNPDPAFLDWADGLEPETLDLLPRPNLSGLTPQERAAAVREYTTQNLFIGWRKLTRAKNPALYRAIEFRKTPAYGVACDGAVAGTELVDGVKEQLGGLWPDKGLIENERYKECRAALGELRDRIVEELGESEEEREEYRRWWPFD
ncbi:phosphotransferase enzyme family protein [Aspergillus luchuensis]|uniref:Altered inheritance of mitochondria protein 9, mitochondrial n=1 Tax=Aspergillus kawachii TaxID=1069201 RepID=A0A146FFL8_ASPKA|nr:phosphotransferase enzyme family protein [Aspergillus luchuensis]